jgi:alpha-N-acetylglucosamine transferase
LLVFELTQFEKVVFIDADMMVMQNLDCLFSKPHMSATNAGFSFPGNENDIDLNSGLMVIEPQPNLVEQLLSTIPSILMRKKAFGDQDLLQAFYSEWPSRPELNFGEKYNVYANYLEYYIRELNYHFNSNVDDPKSIAIVHFIGASKPWHARWNIGSIVYQDIRLLYYRCFGLRNAEWVKLEYKHLIRIFRRQCKIMVKKNRNGSNASLSGCRCASKSD